MNKFLKIGGIFLGVFVFFVIVVIFMNAYRSMLSGSSNSFGSADVSTSSSLPSRGFSNPLSTNSSKSEKMAVAPSAVSDGTSVSQDLAQTDKKIIKNGDLTLKVNNADESAKKISEIAKNNNGEVFSTSFYQSASNVKNGTITVKVPVANFEKTFAEIKKVASLVVRESISGQDVTEQYVDLQAQIKNRQAEEQSYIKILDRAQKIEDVLAVTQQLSMVRGNIEQLQGRIKYLESQTDMSTISAQISEDQAITVIDSWRPWQIVKESFNSLAKILQGFVNFIIRLIIVIIPFLIIFLAIWAIIIWAVYRVGKKIYLKIKNGNNQ